MFRIRENESKRNSYSIKLVCNRIIILTSKSNTKSPETPFNVARTRSSARNCC